MRTVTLILIAALGGATGACRESGVTSSGGLPSDLSAGRSVLIDGVTYTEALSIYDGVVGGFVRGWATPSGVNGTPYTLGPVQANGGEASYVVERQGYHARLEAVPYTPRCRFHRWVIGLNTYNASRSISIGDYRGSSSFVAEFICAA